MTRLVVLQPAFILNHRQYRESSLIAEVLTPDFGRFAVIAKGVRRNTSKFRAVLRPFTPLLLSCSGRGELKTLTHLEASAETIDLPGISLYCGYYMNELIMYFLHRFDPHPEVFQLYRHSLSELRGTSSIETLMRAFELDLLTYVGFGLQLEYDAVHQKPVSADKFYIYRVDSGPVESADGDIDGKSLLALAARSFNHRDTMRQAKKIMRTAIDFHLTGKEIKSRAVISNILKQQAS